MKIYEIALENYLDVGSQFSLPEFNSFVACCVPDTELVSTAVQKYYRER